jgi:hypothetical protein
MTSPEVQVVSLDEYRILRGEQTYAGRRGSHKGIVGQNDLAVDANAEDTQGHSSQKFASIFREA